MNDQPKKQMRLLAIFLAFLCSLFLTGCGGGGGGGGGGGSPIGPSPTTTGNVDGYVSQNLLAPNLKANIGAAITNPLNNAEVTLIALDDVTGAETVLGTGRTDDKGYYQIKFTSQILILRNLIVRAMGNGQTFEALLPKVTNGLMVRAPTMDPDSDIPVRIIKEAARRGKHLEINLGELLAVLPPEALKELESKIVELVNSLIAREAAKEQKFGGRLAEMRQYAFELQQRINESIEKGEMTPEEGWKLFNREMTSWAESKGFSAEDLQILDDMDQAFIFEPFKKDLENAPQLHDEFDNIAAERLKERKLAFLSVVAESVKLLAGAKAGTDYAPFFQLVEKIRASLEGARTPDEIHRFFKDNGHLFLEFGKYLASALLEVKFTPELVKKVFELDLPQYGFGTIGSDGSGQAGAANGQSSPGAMPPEMQDLMAPNGDPAGKALGFVRMQEEFITNLMSRVKGVADQAALQLSPEQIKAVAYIIWAQSEENLNFPQPPVPGDDSQYPMSMAGKVEKLTTPKTTEGVSHSFTHQLKSADYVQIMARATGQVGTEMYPMPPQSQVIAFLAEDKPIELVKISETGEKSVTQVHLADLEAYPFLEVEGMLLKSPYQPMPMPTPADPTHPGPDQPMPMDADQFVPGNSGSGSSGSGATEPGIGIAYPTEVEPMFLLVTRARVLPPPPPPPEQLSNEPGKVIQATADGRPVPGVFVFGSTNAKYDGSVLQPMFWEMRDVSSLSLTQWIGKDVKISGTFYQEDGKKVIGVTEIQ